MPFPALAGKKAALKSAAGKKAALKSAAGKNLVAKKASLKGHALKPHNMKAGLKSSSLKPSATKALYVTDHIPSFPDPNAFDPNFPTDTPIHLPVIDPSQIPETITLPHVPPIDGTIANVDGTIAHGAGASVQVHANPTNPSVTVEVPDTNLPGHPGVTTTVDSQGNWDVTATWNF